MHKGEGEGHGLRGQWLTDQLGLNADQQAKIKAIFEASRSQVQAIKQDTSLSQEDKRAKLQAIHEANDTQIRALLTPDQQQKFDALKAERKQKHDQGGAPQQPPQQ